MRSDELGLAYEKMRELSGRSGHWVQGRVDFDQCVVVGHRQPRPPAQLDIVV